jgi:hypothetical protein
LAGVSAVQAQAMALGNATHRSEARHYACDFSWDATCEGQRRLFVELVQGKTDA